MILRNALTQKVRSSPLLNESVYLVSYSVATQISRGSIKITNCGVLREIAVIRNQRYR